MDFYEFMTELVKRPVEEQVRYLFNNDIQIEIAQLGGTQYKVSISYCSSIVLPLIDATCNNYDAVEHLWYLAEEWK